MGISIIIALIIGAVVVATIALACLTIKKLKELVKPRLERKKKSKVAFGSTQKIINEHAGDILKQAPSITMEELEKMADDLPYFIVDYDPVIDEDSDFTTIQAEKVEEKVEKLFYENDGIVLFD